MTGTILIAGGDPAQRIGLRARLAQAAYEVAQAPAGEDALRIARRSRPDVVVVIEGAPQGGAARLCAALRGDSQLGGAGIVVLADSAEGRLAGLRAGADDALPLPLDELMLLARIRRLTGLPRAMPEAAMGMAEGAAPFAPALRIALIAPDAATAIGWRHALASRITARLDGMSPAQALQAAAQGQGADLYVIAADIAQGVDGLRLLSELRARPASSDAAFVVALAPERAGMAPVALDLGAGDVLPLSLRDPFAAEEAAIRLASQLALRSRAIEQRREAERNRLWAITDPLTGLFNRRYALPRLGEMLAEAGRAHRPLAVMVLDLDRFKAINDRWGHAAGDAVLSQVAARLADCLGPDDLLARLGGEEFLIACPDHSSREALATAETLRARIAATAIPLPAIAGGGGLAVTASIGLAISDRHHALSAEALMACADRALISAKSTGRNRVTLAPFEAAA